MEAIIKRLLIVITLGFVAYGGYEYLSNVGKARSSESESVESERASALVHAELDQCIQKLGSRISCMPEVSLAVDASIRAERNRDAAQLWRRLAADGAAAALFGLGLWPVFFLLRWIFTGRLKRKPRET